MLKLPFRFGILTFDLAELVEHQEVDLKESNFCTNCTNFCIQFRITLKSMRSQCHRQRKFLNMLLNLRPVRRIELYTKVCTDLVNKGADTKFIGFKNILESKCIDSISICFICYRILLTCYVNYFLDNYGMSIDWFNSASNVLFVVVFGKTKNKKEFKCSHYCRSIFMWERNVHEMFTENLIVSTHKRSYLKLTTFLW